jgi:hypothetical protein
VAHEQVEEEVETCPALVIFALLSAQAELSSISGNLRGELGCRTGHGDRVPERGKEQGCGMAFGDESAVTGDACQAQHRA